MVDVRRTARADHDVHIRLGQGYPPGRSDCGQGFGGIGLVVGIRPLKQIEAREFVGKGAVGLGLLDQFRAALGLSVDRKFLGHGQRPHRTPGRVAIKRTANVGTEQHADTARGGLRPDVCARRVTLRSEGHDLAVLVRQVRKLEESEGDGSAGGVR